ncbi:hypothetical protein DFH06DRAFT_313599 [Mycena polygramma]|nr:hypothetical protein DFH06DRAFT_313599 [Mycena polygramma]
MLHVLFFWGALPCDGSDRMVMVVVNGGGSRQGEEAKDGYGCTNPWSGRQVECRRNPRVHEPRRRSHLLAGHCSGRRSAVPKWACKARLPLPRHRVLRDDGCRTSGVGVGGVRREAVDLKSDTGVQDRGVQ